MLLLEPGLTEIELDVHAGARLLLLGGLPFESPILLWWNLVGRTQEELELVSGSNGSIKIRVLGSISRL